MKFFKTISITFVSLIIFQCGDLPYVPEDDAIIYLTALPDTIEAGEHSLIQIIGEKGNGYPLPDSTVVYLFASSGQIDSEVTLINGRAEATYISDSDFIGDVAITSHSGQATISPEELIITVSEVNEPDIAYLYISANPITLPEGGGQSSIRVVAFDEDMVPVTGKNIWLETTAGTLSGNGVYITDANGEVETKLTTDQTATVTAKYKELSASVTITVE